MIPITLAITTAVVAFTFWGNEININYAPFVDYQFFPSEERALSTNMENHLMPYNNEPPIGAGGPKTTFLLGIFSASGEKYTKRRSYIRNTYLADDPRICKLSEYKRQVVESPNEVKCQVPYTFVVGAGGKNRPTDHDDYQSLTLETDQYGNVDSEGDCTYLNIKENMEDGKSTTYFKFGASLVRDYSIDYFGKIDDDSVLAPKLLFQLLEDDLPPAPYNSRIYGGSSWASYAHDIMVGFLYLPFT